MACKVLVFNLLIRQNVRYFCKRSSSSLSFNNLSGDGFGLREKRIGLTEKDQKSLLRKRNIPKYDDMRALNVAIIGAPNAGKSTLANKLIGWKFAPVSSKVHTTRHKSIGVSTEDDKQVVFLDTPGVIVPESMKKHNLQRSLLIDPHLAMFSADLIVVVIDVSHIWHKSRLDLEVLKMLYLHQNKPSVLVLNKVDLVKDKKELLKVTRNLTEGIVDGVQNWSISKHRKKVDLEALFKVMRKEVTELKENKSGEKNHEINNDGGESLQEAIEKTNIIQNSDLQPSLNDIKISSDRTVDTSPADEYSNNETFSNLADPDIWKLYYKHLHRIGVKISDKAGWPNFKKVFMISAQQGDGIYELRNYLLDHTYRSPWKFNSDVVTNENPIELAKLCIFEKLLDHLPNEIPYRIEMKLTMWEVTEDNYLMASFDLICNRKRDVRSILGKNGEVIKSIAAEAKQELMNAFRREMSLQLVVKGSAVSKYEHFKKLSLRKKFDIKQEEDKDDS